MEDLRALYLEAASTALELIALPEVGERWSSASILNGYTVGGLAAHLGRALVTVDSYLEGGPSPDDAAVVDAPGYCAAVLGDHNPVNSEFHAAVRQRGESVAELGQQEVVESLRAVLGRLEAMAVDLDRHVAVLSGITMTLGEYLKTRLVEIVVHCRDLTDSVGIDATPMSESCWDVAARVVVDLAILRSGPEAVTLALARADRMPGVAAF